MITKTVGGDRLGSGKKMQAHLHNYYRSTHNLSEKWASSMSSGVLYPAMVKLGLRGDVFDFHINADARTIPTKGPLFGTYKMQIDLFQCPIRLYQAILHNNPLNIGLNMSQVKFPKMEIKSKTTAEDSKIKFNNSCLVKYLGLSGIGRSAQTQSANEIGRQFNAIPMLSYYDIYKNYYANKQEETGYIISGASQTETIGTTSTWEFTTLTAGTTTCDYNDEIENEIALDQNAILRFNFNNLDAIMEDNTLYTAPFITISAEGVSTTHALIGVTYSIYDLKQISNHTNGLTSQAISVLFATNEIIIQLNNIYTDEGTVDYTITAAAISKTISTKKKLVLQNFELSNIDDMRYDILSSSTLGSTFVISEDSHNYLPYSINVDRFTDYTTYNSMPMNGLALKTYQNDIFNNWLNTEWIEGENGINELSKVAIVDGAFSMDSLNFAEKVYNMLNRVAVAGGTYEDWQDVVYEPAKRRQIETPIFLGGMSQELVFDEIVQTAPATIDDKNTQLGTLGGRGSMKGNSKKGGRIHVKCDEACFIIAIVSLTPRIFYTQGNEFYMTELDSMDDLHKPGMDGIGFQDLIGERLAYWDTTITPNSTTVLNRSKVGKLPAWIEYMTSYDRAYGDFAETDGKGYMILNRNYEQDESTGGIKDASTYVDPSKYNYAFAYTELEAQNFWVEIEFTIKARRLMSARLIPNV